MRPDRVFSVLIFLLTISACASVPRNAFVLKGKPEKVDTSVLPNAMWLPDGHIPTLVVEGRVYSWFSAAGKTFRVSGAGPIDILGASPVHFEGPSDNEDNGGAWFYSVLRPAGSESLLSFYHSEDQLWKGKVVRDAEGIPISYKNIRLAISDDAGLTWKRAGTILSDSQPKPETAQWSGIGDHSTIIHDGYFWIYFSRHFIYLARAPVEGLGRPGTWKKYFSDGLTGGFTEPGLGGRSSPIVDSPGGNPSVIYIESLKKFIMVFHSHGTDSSLFTALSKDGLKWEKPQLLLKSNGRDKYRYATLVQTEGTVWIYFGYWSDNKINHRLLMRQQLSF